MKCDKCEKTALYEFEKDNQIFRFCSYHFIKYAHDLGMKCDEIYEASLFYCRFGCNKEEKELNE